LSKYNFAVVFGGKLICGAKWKIFSKKWREIFFAVVFACFFAKKARKKTARNSDGPASY